MRRKLTTITLLGLLICAASLFVIARPSPRRTFTQAPPSVIVSSATPVPSATLISTSTRVSSSTPIRNFTPSVIPTGASIAASATSQPSRTSTRIPSPATPRSAPTNTRPPQPTAAPVWTLISLTSPISPNSIAQLSIQTIAGAGCSLAYTTPSGTQSTAQGLGATTADASGVCAWSWKIGPSTNPGAGRLSVTANGVTKSLDILIQ